MFTNVSFQLLVKSEPSKFNNFKFEHFQDMDD